MAEDDVTNVVLAVIMTSETTVAEMGDRGHNRHEPKREGAVPLLG